MGLELGDGSRAGAAFRTIRLLKSAAVTSGVVYYEVELLTDGPVRVGWCRPNAPADMPLGLGHDAASYAWATDLNARLHNGRADLFGARPRVGDVIGCVLDCEHGYIRYTLNGVRLKDSHGSPIAFADVARSQRGGWLPAVSLGAGVAVRVNLGRDPRTLRCCRERHLTPFHLAQSSEQPWLGFMYTSVKAGFTEPGLASPFRMT